MALVLIPQTADSVLLDVAVSPLDRAPRLDPSGQLGFGLLRPFRRDEKNDFASAGSVELLKACVGQVLGMRGAGPTSAGELDWDPDRGSLLYLLRHQGSDLVLQQLGRVYVADALRRWEPRILLRKTRVSREAGPAGPDNVLSIRLTYDVLAAPAPSNSVLLSGVDQTVSFKQAA